MGEEKNIVVLNDDEGNEVEFEHITTIEMNDECYVILLPVKEPDDGVVILKLEVDENDEEILVVVDDEEATAVLKKYDESEDE